MRLLYVHPPKEVHDAFRDVASAQENKLRTINRARTFAVEDVNRAEGEAAAVIEEALAFKEARILRAEGEAAGFGLQVDAYRRAPGLTRFRLQLETIEAVHARRAEVRPARRRRSEGPRPVAPGAARGGCQVMATAGNRLSDFRGFCLPAHAPRARGRAAARWRSTVRCSRSMSPSTAWSAGSATSCGWSRRRAFTSSCRSIACCRSTAGCSIRGRARPNISPPTRRTSWSAASRSGGSPTPSGSSRRWGLLPAPRSSSPTSCSPRSAPRSATTRSPRSSRPRPAGAGSKPWSPRFESAVQAYALPAFGIEVVDVDLRQLYLPEANRQSVFERMEAERGRIAKQFRSEGERDATRMIAEADREKTRITAEADREAARIRAEGEAGAMDIYTDAFSQDPAFYKFLRSLQAYEKFLDDQTTLFLPADAEILAILHAEGVIGRSHRASRRKRPSPTTCRPRIWTADRAPRRSRTPRRGRRRRCHEPLAAGAKEPLALARPRAVAAASRPISAPASTWSTPMSRRWSAASARSRRGSVPACTIACPGRSIRSMS